MTTIAGVRALPQAQKGFRLGAKRIYRTASERITAMLVRSAGRDGIIEPRQERVITRAAGEIIQSLFVGSDGRSAYADDGATPLAAYPRLVNSWVGYVTYRAVHAHYDWMRRTLPDDVFRWLARARRPESVREMIDVSARMLPGFLPNALAQYDPLHRWVDPNGYTLSDRIWRAGGDTRQRIDAILSEGIRNGEGALQLSRKLEQFLLPGRAQLRTYKPYGVDASYRGMLLGRTEIARAHGEATLISARLNPYVSGIDWALSASHPKMDICDQLATIGMGGGRLKEPYDLYGVPGYPPHPQCVLPGIRIGVPGGQKYVEFIQNGDMVLTHRGRYRPVAKVWSKPYDGEIVQITTDFGVLMLTPEHPVMTQSGWVNAGELKAGTVVLLVSLRIKAAADAPPDTVPTAHWPIKEISHFDYSGPVYNMEVIHDNSYVAEDIAVHNCLCTLLSVVTSTPAQVTNELRGFMEAGEEPPVTPASEGVLLWLLLGAAFYEWWQRNKQEVVAI